MTEKLDEYLKQLVGTKLNRINLATQMIILDFGKMGIHCQTWTRISKYNDILFTTYDYQSWDEKVDTNNDEWYFFDKYQSEIVNGSVENIYLNQLNDLTIFLDNGIKIEIFVGNGYFHYAEEQEQWRLLVDVDSKTSQHIVVYNKHIEEE